MGYYPTGAPAAHISALIAKYLHRNGVSNSYPDQPDGVVEASCIAGIYPYVSPSIFTSSSQIVTGYFKEDNVPSDSTASTTYTLPDLTSFSAEIVNNNQIQVTFASTDTSGSTTYNIGGFTFSLPSYSQIYYAVDIIESSGKTVYTEKLSTNTGILNYTLSEGTYTIVGYYTDESGDTTSNQISQSIVISDENE